MGREDWGGGSAGAVAVETVDLRAGKTGRLFGLGGGRRDDDDEGPVLEVTEEVPSIRRQVLDGSVSRSESSSFIWPSSWREPSLSIGVEIIDKQPT